jgi:hypothetical protein
MPKTIPPEKKELIEALLAQPLLAHVGTANLQTGQPHITLVWYRWDGDAVWISGFRSTRKFREILANPKVAILIEPLDPRGQPIQAVLFEGTSEIITEPRDFVAEQSRQIYLRYLGEEGVLTADPQSWMHDPENLVVKLKPAQIYIW